MFTLRQWSFAEKERRYTPHIHTNKRTCVCTYFILHDRVCLPGLLSPLKFSMRVCTWLALCPCLLCVCVCGRNCKQSEYKNWPLGWGNYFHFLCTLARALSLSCSLSADIWSLQFKFHSFHVFYFTLYYIYIYIFYVIRLFWFYLMLCHAYFQQPSLSRKRLRIWLKMLFKPKPPLDPTPLWAL